MAWHMVYTGERYACAWEEWDPATMGALKASLRSSGFQVLSFLSAPLLIFCLRFLHTTGYLGALFQPAALLAGARVSHANVSSMLTSLSPQLWETGTSSPHQMAVPSCPVSVVSHLRLPQCGPQP